MHHRTTLPEGSITSWPWHLFFFLLKEHESDLSDCNVDHRDFSGQMNFDWYPHTDFQHWSR